MNKKEQQTEGRIKQPKEEFKSNFKSWIRVVVFIFVAVFLHIANIDTALAIRNDLKTATSTCGTKALYDYLNYTGIQAAEGDIAIMALTVDILNDVVKPEGNPKIIKNSLYALSQAAKFFGADLSPVKLKADSELNKLTPFIAHLTVEHYILVTRVSEDKVYYSDNHKEEFWPKDKFLSEFSGYALTNILPQDLKVLNPAESKRVLGARVSKGNYHVISTSGRAQIRKQYRDYSRQVVKNLNSYHEARTRAGLTAGLIIGGTAAFLPAAFFLLRRRKTKLPT